MSRNFQIGDMLEIIQPITTVMGTKVVDTMFHVIIEREDSMCNSDGEDWWIEWDTIVLETGKKWRLSSRHNINQIRKVS